MATHVPAPDRCQLQGRPEADRPYVFTKGGLVWDPGGSPGPGGLAGWRSQLHQVGAAWTVAFPGVTGAIVGARRPGQVDGWLPATTLELKEDDLARHRRGCPPDTEHGHHPSSGADARPAMR
jgi:hypothetical protein